MTHRIDDVRKRAQRILQGANVLLDGHFDFGNGYHGRTYLNPHMLFCQPSTIWQLAQDLLDVLPYDVSTRVQAVVGPATGGALLAHTIAGLLDGRRSLDHPPCVFAPVHYDAEEGLRLRSTYRAVLAGKKVLLADDVRNTGKTFSHCAELVRKAGGQVIATAQIYDRMAAVVTLHVPNFFFNDTATTEIYTSTSTTCPQCAAGVPMTSF
jgi:orotate phosphoribosyltransferase